MFFIAKLGALVIGFHFSFDLNIKSPEVSAMSKFPLQNLSSDAGNYIWTHTSSNLS